MQESGKPYWEEQKIAKYQHRILRKSGWALSDFATRRAFALASAFAFRFGVGLWKHAVCNAKIQTGQMENSTR